MSIFSDSFGQRKCRDIDSILVEIAKANYFKDSKINTGLASVSFSERIDSQYLRFEELKYCASNELLRNLLRHENNLIVAYAWKAFLVVEPSEALQFLLVNSDSLDERKFTIFINYCQGYYESKLTGYMIRELYDKLIEKEIKLTADEIIAFLIFTEGMIRKWHSVRGTGDF